MNSDATMLIQALGLQPHPEGGWYRETWRAEGVDGARSPATAVLYLLEEGQRSRWHKVDATEMWLFHAGSSLKLQIAPSEGGPILTTRLGADVLAGDEPQLRIEPYQWQSAEADRGWGLISCLVVPGFEFSGFTMAPDGWSPG